MFAQEFELTLGLDTLGDGPQAEAVGECDHGTDQGVGLGIVADFVHETRVDLEHVERQAGEVGEIREAGTEIVQVDAVAVLLDRAEHRDRCLPAGRAR